MKMVVLNSLDEGIHEQIGTDETNNLAAVEETIGGRKMLQKSRKGEKPTKSVGATRIKQRLENVCCVGRQRSRGGVGWGVGGVGSR